jgi:hypothetical protein
MMRVVTQAFLRVIVMRVAWMVAAMSRGASMVGRARGRLLPRGAARSSMAD